MIDVLYVTTANQTTCSVLRMKIREGEAIDQFIVRAKAKVAKIGGHFCYIGV